MTQRPVLVGAITLVTALVTSVTAIGSAAAGTNVLANGSFEWPGLKGAVSRSFVAGEHVGRWRVTTGPVFVSSSFPGIVTTPAGDQIMNLRPTPLPGPGDGEICQTVAVVAGATYKIRFLAASIFADSTIDVTFGGTDVAHVDVTGSIPAPFTLYEWHVTAPADSADLCLHGHPLTDGSVPVVDAVRVKPVRR
jgi:Protein of unknown function (DUF642)